MLISHLKVRSNTALGQILIRGYGNNVEISKLDFCKYRVFDFIQNHSQIRHNQNIRLESIQVGRKPLSISLYFWRGMAHFQVDSAGCT